MKNAAIGICFDASKNVLLIKRSDVPLWVLPGGGIEENESAEIAAVRELQEEANVQVQIVRKVGEYFPKNWMTSHTTVFECALTHPHIPSPGDEALGARFFPLDNLPSTLFFLHKEWIDDALKMKKEPIIRTIDSVTWMNIFKFLIRHPVLAFRYILARAGLPINS